MKNATPADSQPELALSRRHLRLGWLALLVFLTFGIALEAMHGFKVDLYLNVANETRRLLWTLAHAHGVLLGLVHIAFASTIRELPAAARTWPKHASLCLSGSTVLLPAGFFLGGTVTYGGDPGRGILLVPVGAALLFAGVLITALRVGR